MITVLEEVMDVVDSARSCVELVQEHYESVNPLSGVLWSVQWQLERVMDLLAIIEAEDAPTNKEVPATPVTAAEADTETNHDNSITISKEIPTMKEPKPSKPAKSEKNDKKFTGKYGKAFRAWRDKGAGPSKIVELCDVNMETAARWVREFVEMQK